MFTKSLQHDLTYTVSFKLISAVYQLYINKLGKDFKLLNSKEIVRLLTFLGKIEKTSTSSLYQNWLTFIYYKALS